MLLKNGRIVKWTANPTALDARHLSGRLHVFQMEPDRFIIVGPRSDWRPACGIGHFICCMPDEMHPRSTITGIEIEPITARVAKLGEMQLEGTSRRAERVGVGYFFVWTVFGMAAFPLGVALAAVEMQQPALARAVPIAVGVVVLIADAL